MPNQNRPPESERPAPPQVRPSAEHTNAVKCNAPLRRRRNAANESHKLACGCRDPWTCKHHRDDRHVSDKHAEAAVAAIQHLDEIGIAGLLDRETCRAMWRVGARELAVQVDARTRGLVA